MVNVRCPNCQATYQLDPAKLADGGRKLKCAQCGTVWVARAEDSQTPPLAEVPSPVPPTEEAPQSTPLPESSPDQPPETAEDDLPPPPQEVLIQRSPGLDDLVQIGGWRTYIRGDNAWRTGAMGFIAVGILVGGLVLWSILGTSSLETAPTHEELPPPAETSSEAIQPPEGVVLHRVRGEVTKLEGSEQGVSLTVRGLLTNTTSGSLVVPPLRLELLGSDGSVADMWPVTDMSSTMPPAAEQAWSVSMSAPDMESVKGWRVVFVGNH